MATQRRRLAALMLALGVTCLQLWLLDRAIDPAEGLDRRARRIEVAFVRVLLPTAPARLPTLQSLPAPPTRRAPGPTWLTVPDVQVALAPPESAASAVEAASLVASAPGVAVVPPSAPEPAASGASPPFDWPPSTRLRYALRGNYRGEISGTAQVEWLRQGSHYQVNLDVTIGPPFAPVITRQMRSDGELGPAGLRPTRFDESTWILFRGRRSASIRFEPGWVYLPNGRRTRSPDGVQDAVSQFVQLTWLFTLHPDRLVAGRQVTVPLALPRAVSPWVYDVRETETLATPAGPVQAVRLQPRRDARAGDDLVPEMWFAPSLQYLPVRILIRQGADNVVDMLIDRLPEQAADETAAVPPRPVQSEPRY